MMYFQVPLGHGGNGAVDDVNRAQHDEDRHPGFGALGQQDHPDPDNAKSAQLHQHAGVKHTDAGGGRHVTVGRPGVEGPKAGQHTKPNHEQGEDPVLECRAEHTGLGQPPHLNHGEGGAAGIGRHHVHRQYAHPNEHTARHQDEHQLHRAIFLGPVVGTQVKGQDTPQPLAVAVEHGTAAPHANQQVHGQHGQLVKEEQEEQVLDNEDAKNPGTQGQEQHKEVPATVLNRLGNQDGAKQDNAVKQHQGGGDAVHGEVQVYVEGFVQPLVHPGELVTSGGEVVPHEEDY